MLVPDCSLLKNPSSVFLCVFCCEDSKMAVLFFHPFPAFSPTHLRSCNQSINVSIPYSHPCVLSFCLPSCPVKAIQVCTRQPGWRCEHYTLVAHISLCYWPSVVLSGVLFHILLTFDRDVSYFSSADFSSF